MATSPIFPGTPKNFGITFVNADGTTSKVVFAAGASGSIVDILNIRSDDTSARHVVFELYNGVTGYDLSDVLVPIGAGTDGGTTPSVNGLSTVYTPSLGNREDRAIYLATGWSLRAHMKVAVTAAKTITVAGCYGDF